MLLSVMEPNEINSINEPLFNCLADDLLFTGMLPYAIDAILFQDSFMHTLHLSEVCNALILVYVTQLVRIGQSVD